MSFLVLYGGENEMGREHRERVLVQGTIQIRARTVFPSVETHAQWVFSLCVCVGGYIQFKMILAATGWNILWLCGKDPGSKSEDRTFLAPADCGHALGRVPEGLDAL